MSKAMPSVQYLGLSIQTKYLGPTNVRGARIKAFTLDNNPTTERPDSVTLSYDYALDGAKAHEPAMIELHNKLSHNPELIEWQEKKCSHVAISTGTNKGYIYIFKDKE
tara:strand:- start:1590 stop:1913 length:324 start_codon:yes stop_codon:yes gene_type:complete